MPVFCEYFAEFPKWKPVQQTQQEWKLIQCLTAQLAVGEDRSYRDLILSVGTLLGSNDTNPYVKEGRALSGIVRHLDKDRQERGLARLSGQDGYLKWADLEDYDVLPYHIKILDPMILALIISMNDKGRYECKVEAEKIQGVRQPLPRLYIRATQGQSYTIDKYQLFGAPITEADAIRLSPVVHGTWKNLAKPWILGDGLKPGGGRKTKRQAVHFMAFGWHRIKPEGPFSTIRSSSEYLIIMDLAKWLRDGKEAFVSPNGVVNIFETVPPEYFLFHAPITVNTPKTPEDWLAFFDTSSVFQNYRDAMGPGDDAAQAANPEGNPESAQADEEEIIIIRFKDQSTFQREWDLFGDSIPRFTAWQALSPAQRAELEEDGIRTEDGWYLQDGSGYGTYAMYLIVRGAKVQLAFNKEDQDEYGMEKWEHALLFKMFQGKMPQLKAMIYGAVKLLKDELISINAQGEDLLKFNWRITPTEVIAYAEMYALTVTGSECRPEDLPIPLQWEKAYFDQGQRIHSLDVRRLYMPGVTPLPTDLEERRQFEEELELREKVNPDEGEEVLVQEEDLTYSDTLHERNETLAMESVLDKILALEDRKPESEPAAADDELGADFDIDEPEELQQDNKSAKEEQEEPETIEEITSSTEEEVQETLEERASSAQVEPKEPKPKTDLRSKKDVYKNLRRWATSVLNDLAEKEKRQSDTAQAVQENETWEEPQVNTSQIPPHPQESMDLLPFLDTIKELLKNPKGAPESRHDVKWHHGDARKFLTPELLIKARAKNQEALDSFNDAHPVTQQEVNQLFDDMTTLLPGRTKGDFIAQVHQWSSQLVFASLNLGNLRRQAYIPQAKGGSWKNKGRQTMLLKFLQQCPAHVMTLAEAAGIQDECVKQEWGNWNFISSWDTNLAVGTRTNRSGQCTILLDTTNPNMKGGRDFEDDPTTALNKEKYLWYMIVEVDFGVIDNTDHPDYQGTDWPSTGVRPSGRVNHATYEQMRVLVFMIDNKVAAKNAHSVRLRLRQMFLDIARYQVDLLGGDANGAIYKYFPNQEICSIKQSSFAVMADTFTAAVNSTIQELHKKIGVQMVTSNSQETLERLALLYNQRPGTDLGADSEDYNIDCMVGMLISWGHSDKFRKWRDEIPREETFEILEQGFPECEVKVAEYPMSLDNRHLWLNNTGHGDHDWHTPLIVRYRFLPEVNVRKGTAAALERRHEKQRQKLVKKQEQWAKETQQPQSSSSSSWQWTWSQQDWQTGSSSSSTSWKNTWSWNWWSS